MQIATHGLECSLQMSAPDIEGWMRTSIDMKVPGFDGGFSCTIEVNEWKQFIQSLRRLTDSVGTDAELSWSNMEANVEFRLKLHKRGAVEGSYKFSPENLSLGPVLSGSFEADQSFLSLWLGDAERDLANVLANHSLQSGRTVRR